MAFPEIITPLVKVNSSSTLPAAQTTAVARKHQLKIKTPQAVVSARKPENSKAIQIMIEKEDMNTSLQQLGGRQT